MGGLLTRRNAFCKEVLLQAAQLSLTNQVVRSNAFHSILESCNFMNILGIFPDALFKDQSILRETFLSL
jgi:hypothetical protein